jgi:hypothetical protein
MAARRRPEMFDNLFMLGGPMWVAVPLVATVIAFGGFVIGFDAKALRVLARRS